MGEASFTTDNEEFAVSKMIFVNFPVKDLAAATAFYKAIGCEQNMQFSDEKASSMMWSDSIAFMLLKHEFYSTFTDKPIADGHAVSAHLIALTLDSREAVDALLDKAGKAGGRCDFRPTQDYGFMYSRAFEDLDGNTFEPVWMNPEGMGQG